MKTKALFIILFASITLSGCNSYRVDVDLDKDEVSKIKADIASYQEIIDDYDYSDGTIPWEAIINQVNAYIDLGELGKGVKVYEEVLEEGHKTKAILNNLGRLYEKVERYDDAVTIYQRINDEYFDHDYLKDITWAYIRAGNRKEAEKYFNAWQLQFKKTDTQIQQAIKKLREAEKDTASASS